MYELDKYLSVIMQEVLKISVRTSGPVGCVKRQRKQKSEPLN